MSMGGGTFTVQNKILPGSYINFVSTASAATLGERGTAALPLELDWGPEGQIYALEAGEFNQTALKVFGHDATAAELLLIREALKRCSTLLVYRVNDDEEKVDVVTYLEEQEVDRQTVAASGGAADLKANDFVSFGTAETLTAAAATALTGGTNGTVNGAAYAAWLTALEVEDFNAVGYPGTDESVKALVDAFVKRLRDEDGRKVVGVLYQHAGDDIGLISVKNGVVLTDGTVLTGDKAVAWVTGATAGAEVNESLTNTAYDGAVDVDVKYTRGQYEQAMQAGEFVFYPDGGKARVLSDLNSRTSFGGGISEDWTSNRVVRVMDGWANDVARTFSQSYLGTQTNSETGRALFKADLVALGKEYEGIDAISGFAPDDVTVLQGDGKRDVSVACALTPNDSMEKLYMTVAVH